MQPDGIVLETNSNEGTGSLGPPQQSNASSVSPLRPLPSSERAKACYRKFVVIMCQALLSDLIRISGNGTTKRKNAIIKLVQDLIDGAIVAEEFATLLQKECQFKSQPKIVNYLKNNLTFVRQALINGEVTIEGILPLPVILPSLLPQNTMQPDGIVPETNSNEGTGSFGPTQQSNASSVPPLRPLPSSESGNAFSRKFAVKRCETLLSGLIRITGYGPPKMGNAVLKLVQNLIDGGIVAEEFATLLEKECQWKSPPKMINSLKSSLTFVREALINGEVTIQGILPPPVILPSLLPQIKTFRPTPRGTICNTEENSVLAGQPLNGNTVSTQRTVSPSVQQSQAPVRQKRRNTSPVSVARKKECPMAASTSDQEPPAFNMAFGNLVVTSLNQMPTEKAKAATKQILNVLLKFGSESNCQK